jgi:hypothetical protein
LNRGFCALQLDVAAARIPYNDIVTKQQRAAYQLVSNAEQKLYLASQAGGNCAKGMKVIPRAWEGLCRPAIGATDYHTTNDDSNILL